MGRKESDHEIQTNSERKYGIHPDLDFDLCNVASSTDLTGLIPAAPSCRTEVHSYGNLYKYQPQDVTVTLAEDHTKEE